NWTRRSLKKPSGATNRASARSRTRAAKAASISWLVLALRGLDLQSDRARRFRHLSKRSLEAPSIAWIDQHGNANGLGHQFAQQPKPLGPHLRDEKIDASRVAPGARKAGDKTQLDRVFTDTEDDRDSGSSSFGCKRSRIANCGDNCYATAYEIGHERRQAIVLAAEPVVLDDHVLILHVARFGEAFTKRGCMACGTIE